MGKFVERQRSGGRDCVKEVFELQKLHQSLLVNDKEEKKEELLRVTENISGISGKLVEKIGFDEVEEVIQTCEEIAKLKLEIKLEEGWQMKQYQAMIELPK